MKSKLPGVHNIAQVFDSVTAAEDSMKSKLPGAHNTKRKATSQGHLTQESKSYHSKVKDEDRASGKENKTEAGVRKILTKIDNQPRTKYDTE